MKKLILGITLLVFTFLALTNPSEEDHKFQIVKEYNYTKYLDEDVLDTSAISEDIIDALAISEDSKAQRLGENFGNIIVERELKDNTYSKNYLLFSLTYYRGKYCGVGFLNSVYISNEFTEVLKSIQ